MQHSVSLLPLKPWSCLKIQRKSWKRKFKNRSPTSGNPPGATTCGAGVTCRGSIHGTIWRELPQCFRLLHPWCQIRSLCGFAVNPGYHHHTLAQEKVRSGEENTRRWCGWDAHSSSSTAKNFKWPIKAHSCALSQEDMSRVHSVGVTPTLTELYGSGLYAWNKLRIQLIFPQIFWILAFNCQNYISIPSLVG